MSAMCPVWDVGEKGLPRSPLVSGGGLKGDDTIHGALGTLRAGGLQGKGVNETHLRCVA